MKTLSESLRITLFERIGRRSIPTDEARAIVERVREPLEALQNAVSLVNVREVSGAVRIGGPQPFCRMWLRPRLLHLLKTHPRLVPTISYGVPSLLGEQLRIGALDFAILSGPVETEDLELHPIHTESFLAVASPAYAKVRPTTDRFIVFDQDHAMLAPWWRAHYPRRAFSGSIAARVASLDEMLALAVAGIGIAVLPDYFVGDAVHNKSVVVVDPSRARPKNILSLAFRKRVAQTARFLAVKALLLQRS